MVVTSKKIKAEKINLVEPVSVFAIGWGDAEWLTADSNFIESKSVADADLIIFPGGSDINPELYKQPVGRYTHFYKNIDERQLEYFHPYLGKKRFFGICRGLQLLTAMAGGELVQHSSHPFFHRITTYDGKILGTNSLHHQQAYLGNLVENEDYQLLAWAENLSSMHLNGNDVDYDIPEDYKEPEVVYYPKIKAMGIQGHPEMSGMPIETSEWLVEQVKTHLFYDKIKQ